MSKLTADSFEAFVKGGAKTLRAVLIYGQDDGLVEESRIKAARAVVDDLKDPFRAVWLTPAQIKEDISALSAEANALSLMGGRRVIMVRGADNTLTAALKDFLPAYDGDALLLFTAGALKTKDSLPALFEKTAGAGVLACYADEGAALKRLVWQTLTDAGKTAAPDVIEFIAENLGADRLMSRSELNKLITYMGNETAISMDDATACVGDASALSVDQLLYALSGGSQAELHQTLDRLFAEGESPISLLRAASMHLKRFHIVLGKIEDGGSVEDAVKALFLHFKRVNQFKEQLCLWNLAKIGRAMDLLTQAEQDCKKTGRPQQLTVARVFMQIAAQAKR